MNFTGPFGSALIVHDGIEFNSTIILLGSVSDVPVFYS